MASKDFYKLLGLERSATADEIKKAYRKLAKKFHPDVNPGNKAAEEKFKEMTEAYAVLSDPTKRKQYDAVGPDGFQSGFDFSQAFGQGFRPRAGQRTYHFSGGRGAEFNFDMGGLEDIFSSMFGGGGGFQGARAPRMEPEEPTYQVEIDFITAARGGEVELALDREKTRVKIPPGMSTGQTIRLAGKGKRGGDVFLSIVVRPHESFERQGDDIHVEVPVSVTDAILGGSIEVPTIDGVTAMTLPAGTSSGQKMRLKSKGVYRRDGSRGDQYVRIGIAVPKEIDAKSRELIAEFAKRNAKK